MTKILIHVQKFLPCKMSDQSAPLLVVFYYFAVSLLMMKYVLHVLYDKNNGFQIAIYHFVFSTTGLQKFCYINLSSQSHASMMKRISRTRTLIEVDDIRLL